MKKIVAFILVLIFSENVSAGTYTNWAVPTRIDVERGNGVMVFGSFGNAGDCAISDRVYIPESHPQYDKFYALVLTGFSANKEVQFYIRQCQKVGWYSSTEDAFNVALDSVYIRNQ